MTETMTAPREPFEVIVSPTDTIRYVVSVDTPGMYLTDEARGRLMHIAPAALDGIIDALCKARDYQRGMR